MAAGDYTLTNYGTFSVSGAALKTKVDSLSTAGGTGTSGGGLYLIPTAGGQQVQVIYVGVA